MILTLADYRQYLPANTVTDATRFASFERRALQKYFPRYLGKELVALLAGDSLDEGHAQLVARVVPALVNLTYLESVPFFNLVLTSTGFGVVSNQNVAPASMDRVRDLKSACLEAANEGISQLLQFLEENPLEGWNFCSLCPGSLIPDTDAFNEATGLFIPRIHFVEVKPFLQLYERTTLVQAISGEFHAWLLEGGDDLVGPMVKKAMAFGAYDLYHRQPAVDGRGRPAVVNQMWQLVSQRYLSETLALLAKNLDLYPAYRDHGYEPSVDNAQRAGDSSFFIGGLTS